MLIVCQLATCRVRASRKDTHVLTHSYCTTVTKQQKLWPGTFLEIHQRNGDCHGYEQRHDDQQERNCHLVAEYRSRRCHQQGSRLFGGAVWGRNVREAASCSRCGGDDSPRVRVADEKRIESALTMLSLKFYIPLLYISSEKYCNLIGNATSGYNL